MKKTLKIVALIVSLLAPLNAKILYVAIGGDNNITYANNDINNPWAHIARAFWGSMDRTAMVASEAAQAGDTVIVSAGVYDEIGLSNENTASRWLPVLLPANSGTASNPIVFRAEFSAVYEASGLDSTVYIEIDTGGGITSGEPTMGVYTDIDYIKFIGFYIKETTSSNQDGAVIMIHWGDNVTVEECIIEGIFVTYQNNHPGIRVEDARNALIKNNKIFNVQGNYNDHSNAILLYHADSVTIRNNELYDCGTGINVKGSEVWRYEFDIFAYYNRIYNMDDSGLWLMGLDADGGATVTGLIYQNIVTGCLKGITVHGALGGAGEGAYGPQPDSLKVVNNTLDNNARNVQMKFSAAWGLSNRIYGNIFNDATSSCYWADTGDLTELYNSDGSLLYDYNWVDDYPAFGGESLSGTSLATWQGATWEQDINSTFGTDPLFVTDNSDYHLQGGSAAKSACLDILDLDGDESTDDLIDCGAYVSGTETIGIENAVTPTIPTPSGSALDAQATIHKMTED